MRDFMDAFKPSEQDLLGERLREPLIPLVNAHVSAGEEATSSGAHSNKESAAMAFQRGNTAGRNTSGQFCERRQSGNPGGQSHKIREVAAAAREHTVEMLAVLVGIARDKAATASARVSAAQYVMDRAWGRPKESVTITRDENFTDLTDAELAAIARGDFDGEPVTNGSGTAAGETQSKH